MMGKQETSSYPFLPTIQGLTLQFGACFQAAGEHLAILDNTITNFWGQGLVGPGANSVVEGNFIDRIGGPWAEGPGLNWPHCLYGGGDFSTIVDNFFGRSMDGNSVKIYGANHVVFDYNVVYEDDPHDHFHALEVTGGCSAVDIQHNVIVNPEGGGFAMSYGVDGVTFANNYLESDSTGPALLAAADNAPSCVENFQITDNILNGSYGIHFQTNTVLAGSLVAGNTWLNTQYWFITVNGVLANPGDGELRGLSELGVPERANLGTKPRPDHLGSDPAVEHQRLAVCTELRGSLFRAAAIRADQRFSRLIAFFMENNHAQPHPSFLRLTRGLCMAGDS